MTIIENADGRLFRWLDGFIPHNISKTTKNVYAHTSPDSAVGMTSPRGV